ncbi:uncharacterized protein LOC120069934 [Benincasa hispida]|uniref:uncharacterized protein LOC120069934 n=1 Tax=Benincasa hispida TaxID=102211 RepID=UPI001900BFA4|nr:uncharacterized protein LOC120069934 [Benincasa hispida]
MADFTIFSFVFFFRFAVFSHCYYFALLLSLLFPPLTFTFSMVTPKPNAPRLQEPYIGNKDNPRFDFPVEAHVFTSSSGSQDSINGQNAFQSTSDYGDINIKNRKLVSKTINKDTEPQMDDSGLDIIFEPFERSSSGRWLKGGKTSPFAFRTILSNLNLDLEDLDNRTKKHEAGTFQECQTPGNPVRSWIQKSFIVKKRKDDFSGISLPQSAASFYNGWSPVMEVSESCESIEQLNIYLKSKRDEVNAGVPGRFLHVVIGKDVSDVGSVVSTIMYAFYLNETHKYDEFCTVPVINMKRTDLNSHSELKWLLGSCQIDTSSLIFVDEIDLSYYELFGSLKVVLLNSSKLPAKQEQALKEAVVEIFNCNKDESVYPWVENITIQQVWHFIKASISEGPKEEFNLFRDFKFPDQLQQRKGERRGLPNNVKEGGLGGKLPRGINLPIDTITTVLKGPRVQDL